MNTPAYNNQQRLSKGTTSQGRVLTHASICILHCHQQPTPTNRPIRGQCSPRHPTRPVPGRRDQIRSTRSPNSAALKIGRYHSGVPSSVEISRPCPDFVRRRLDYGIYPVAVGRAGVPSGSLARPHRSRRPLNPCIAPSWIPSWSPIILVEAGVI